MCDEDMDVWVPGRPTVSEEHPDTSQRNRNVEEKSLLGIAASVLGGASTAYRGWLSPIFDDKRRRH